MTFRTRPEAAAKLLVDKYGLRPDHAKRAVDIAVELGLNNTPYGDGRIVTIRLVHRPTVWGRARGETDLVTVTKFSDDTRAGKVALPLETDYSQTRRSTRPAQHPTKRTETMPPRGKTATKPAPEPNVEEQAEEAEGERDYTIYADKNITATMQDFAEWIVEEVFDGDQKAFDEADPVRIVSLAGTLRMEFQRSDLNQTRREERRQARAAQAEAEPEAVADEGDEDEAKPVTPRRGRPAKGTAAKPAAKAPASKPAGRRGRPSTVKPATAEAPY